MNFLKLLLFAALAVFGYQFWQMQSPKPAAPTSALTTQSANGFVALPTPTNANAAQVVVFAPDNCPLEAGQRADALVQQLASRNIPYLRSSNASFSAVPDATTMERLNTVMNGEVPIVFINGRGKANPTVQEVIAEYAASR